MPLGYGISGASPTGTQPIDLAGAYALERRTEGLGVYPMDVSLRSGSTYMGSSRSVAVVGTAESLEEARLISLSGVDALKGPLRSRRDVASKLDLRNSAGHMKDLRRGTLVLEGACVRRDHAHAVLVGGRHHVVVAH